MKFMIRSWRTYLTSIVKKLLLNNKKVDEFLAMVEHASQAEAFERRHKFAYFAQLEM
jgi:hypothetical protein